MKTEVVRIEVDGQVWEGKVDLPEWWEDLPKVVGERYLCDKVARNRRSAIQRDLRRQARIARITREAQARDMFCEMLDAILQHCPEYLLKGLERDFDLLD